MLVFIVPIKSAQVSTSWEVFSLLVARTMQSICQQTSDNFKVVAVCHEIPEIGFEHTALEFIQVDFDPPTDEAIRSQVSDDPKNYRNAAKEADKAKKIIRGIEYAKKYHPSHFMVVDADDCISRELVSFVDDNSKDSPGWYFKKGLIYNEGSNLIFLNKNTFNVLCGTCIIINATYVNELLSLKPRPLFHHEITELSNGEKLAPLPFPGAVYSIGNTENYCSTPDAVRKMNSYGVFKKDFYDNIVRKLSKYRVKIVNRKLRETYGLNKLDFSAVFS
ncbi:MAG: glycosyltransferase family 2 protein [Eudoraea sp.]|nr:glycosyltransferase family 2 protein [Eudoraea sp.]